jgi:hypothetical protein
MAGCTVLAAVVDLGVMWKLIVSSLAGGLGATAVFSVAVYAAIRSIDLRRDGRLVVAGAFVVISAVALAALAAAVVFGISVLTAKA